MNKRKSYKKEKSDKTFKKGLKNNVMPDSFQMSSNSDLASSSLQDNSNSLLKGISNNALKDISGSSLKDLSSKHSIKGNDLDSQKTLPVKFESYLREAAGALTDKIIDALLNSEPTISIRLNPFKPLGADIDSVANDVVKSGDRITWCSNGFYLARRPQFTFDPALHAGAYYVQEPSSMFLEMLRPVLQSLSPRNVLDLCAAPGGKSTHLISMLPLGTRITVNEVVKPRLSALRENILKWGVPGIQVTSREAHQFVPKDFSILPHSSDLFDFILVDAPCSGEGMFRKDPDAISEWSEENVKMCVARQKKILKEIWGALRPGGLLAYSTCTFNRYENDMNVVWMKRELGASLISLEEFYKSQGLEHVFSDKIREEWGIMKSEEGGYQFFPGIVRGEGLYFALLQKPESSADSEPSAFQKISALPKASTSKETFCTPGFPHQKGLSKSNSLSGQPGRKARVEHPSSSTKNSSGRASDATSTYPSHEDALFINFNEFENTFSKPTINQSESSNSTKVNKTFDKTHDTRSSKRYDTKTKRFDNLNSQSQVNKIVEWPEYELTKEQALKFLSKESLNLVDAPLGYLKVTYGGLGLGFVKNIGSRANNLLPTNFRIRKQQ